MMDNPTLYALWIYFLCIFTETEAGSYCTKYSQLLFSERIFYCSTSCCGTIYTRYCCHFTLGISVVSGIVISVLVAIGVVVAVVCICMKKQGMRGRVVQPGNNKVTVVYTNTTTQGRNNGIIGPAQPGFYNNQPGPMPPGHMPPGPMPPGYYNNQPIQPMQSGYQITNPTGMVQPGYPPTYPSDGSALTPYTGNTIPPPFNYLNPDNVGSGFHGNQTMASSSVQRRGAQ